jgi:hypothetical protein
MGVFKIKPGDLMRGANIDWPSVIAQQQVTDMKQVNPQMPTRTRGGGQRKPGISENELADFQAQGNGEAGLSAKEPNQKQYEKIAADRAEGNLPEQVVKTPVDRTQRGAVDAENITDPVRQARVNRLAGMIQSSNTANVPGTVDSYDKMLEFLRARQQVDADADKRARRREMFAAIGDGISAISSLYQTTKGAPVTYTPGKDMSEVMRQRYDRYLAQRKANEDKYLNYLKVQAARDNALIASQYKARRLAADETKEERENRRLDEMERHNRELEKYYSIKEQNSKEAKAAEQSRKDNDSAKKNEREEKKAEAYVAAQKKKGSGSSKSKKSSKSSSGNTPPSRRSGNTNNNNVRPSQRK